MENIIIKNIKQQYSHFSKKEKMIANYMINNYSIIGFLGISDLAYKSNVSMSTITRFIRNIGYEDFSAFKKHVIELKEADTMIQEDSHFTSVEDTLKASIDNNINVLSSMFRDDLKINYVKAVEAIKDARRVYVVATRSSYTIAYYLYFMLKDLLENVELVTNGLDDNKLNRASRNDCVIAISYKLYTLSTYKVVEHFNQVGSKIIAITDSYTSPVALKSDIILEVENHDDILSFIGPLTLANAIVNGINAEDIDFYNNKMKLQQNLLIENDVFLKE